MIRADSFHNFNPGTAAPVSFGMANDPSQNMSLNPGAGVAGMNI